MFERTSFMKPLPLPRLLGLAPVMALMLLLSGCIIPKVYLDPQYRAPELSVAATADPKPVKLIVTGLTNRKANSAATKVWTKEVTAALEKSKAFALSDAPDAAILEIEINNIGDTDEAMKKGFVTGLTFGLAGSVVTDRYIMTATYKENGAATFSGEYKHALHTVIGVEDAPLEGVKPTSLRDAPAKLVEDLIFNFVRDFQSKATVAPVAAR